MAQANGVELGDRFYEGLDVGDDEVAEFVYVSFTCSILFIDCER